MHRRTPPSRIARVPPHEGRPAPRSRAPTAQAPCMDHHVLWGTNACHWVRSTPNEDAVRPSRDIPERSRTAQVYPRRCGWYALGLPAVGRLVRRCGTASPRPSEHLATSRCADRSHLPWSRSPRDRPPTTETAKTPEQWTGCSGWADIGPTRLGAPYALEDIPAHSRSRCS